MKPNLYGYFSPYGDGQHTLGACLNVFKAKGTLLKIKLEYSFGFVPDYRFLLAGIKAFSVCLAEAYGFEVSLESYQSRTLK